MSVLAIAVEDHQQLGRPVDRGERVGCHGGELGRLAGLDGDLTVAEKSSCSRPLRTNNQS
jgi:hypothetical protein